MVRRSTVFADCEPEPFTVATWMLRSLTTVRGSSREPAGFCCTAMSLVAISGESLARNRTANFYYELYFIRLRKRSYPWALEVKCGSHHFLVKNCAILRNLS